MPALDILTEVITSGWTFFTDITVPGLNVSFASLLIAVIAAQISLALIRLIFGFGNDGGIGYRSGNSRKAKISDNRKGDTH